MRVLIDIGHPAHVHLFRNAINKLKANGHSFLITARDKKVIKELLEYYQLDYSIRHSSRSGIISKILGLIIILFQLLKVFRKGKPDLLLGGVGNAYIALLGYLTKTPSIIFDDTEHAKSEMFFVKKFASCILTPDCYLKNLGEKQIRYKGYHELAYLHPSQFKKTNFYKESNKEEAGTRLFFLRIVSWEASHDRGHSGLNSSDINNLVDILKKHGKVVISSEKELSENLEPFRYKVAPWQVHDILKKAELFVGEGATMASEAIVLGTSAIYVNSLNVGYLIDQEKYGLISLRNGRNVLSAVKRLLNNTDNKEQSERQAEKILKDKIDVSAFMVWFIENYPESAKIMRENPDYQERFK